MISWRALRLIAGNLPSCLPPIIGLKEQEALLLTALLVKCSGGLLNPEALDPGVVPAGQEASSVLRVSCASENTMTSCDFRSLGRCGAPRLSRS
jgi:hypothetical protein